MAIVEFRKDGHLAIISLNRPQKKNALSAELMAGLAECWTAFQADDDAWLAIFRGGGDNFSVGADFSFLESGSGGDDQRTGLDRWLEIIKQDPLLCGDVDKPTIGVIEGYCLGAALVLALATDLRVCSERATLQIAEVALGFPLLLTDNLPMAVAAELNSGLRIDGRRALGVGLVNRVAPPGQALDAALGLAGELLTKPPLGVHHALRLTRELKPAEDRIPDRRMVELQKELQRTEDFREALAAIREKRPPGFKRR